MIGPNDLKEIDKEDYNIDCLIKELDEAMLRSHGCYFYEKACVGGELPFTIRNQIAEKYLEAGWKYVYHYTASETNRSMGDTTFLFSMFMLKDIEPSFMVTQPNDISALTTPIIVTKNGQDFSKEG